MTLFAIRYDYVEDPALLDAHRAEHRAFLRTLHEAGTLLASGPFADDGPASALLLAQGDAADDVLAAFDEDPFLREGAIAARTIRPWTVVIGGLPGHTDTMTDPAAPPSTVQTPPPTAPGSGTPTAPTVPSSPATPEGPAPRHPVPPFTRESAEKKVQAAEDAWNSRDPEKCAGAYTVDTVWRNRDEHLRGRDEVIAFLRRKWEREQAYRLRKNLWAFDDHRIAVRFQYEWHDADGQWWRSYGNELWEFDELGYMARREASINDLPIGHDELRVTPGHGELPPL